MNKTKDDCEKEAREARDAVEEVNKRKVEKATDGC